MRPNTRFDLITPVFLLCVHLAINMPGSGAVKHWDMLKRVVKPREHMWSKVRFGIRSNDTNTWSNLLETGSSTH